MKYVIFKITDRYDLFYSTSVAQAERDVRQKAIAAFADGHGAEAEKFCKMMNGEL